MTHALELVFACYGAIEIIIFIIIIIIIIIITNNARKQCCKQRKQVATTLPLRNPGQFIQKTIAAVQCSKGSQKNNHTTHSE